MPEPRGGVDAFTRADFTTRFAFVQRADGKFVVNRHTAAVTISLNQIESWVVAGRETPGLLTHEQGHYNLTALGARDIFNGALALVADSADELGDRINSLTQLAQSLIDSANHAYDEDVNCGTQHGTNAANQQQWNLRINRAMNSSTGQLADVASCPAGSP